MDRDASVKGKLRFSFDWLINGFKRCSSSDFATFAFLNPKRMNDVEVVFLSGCMESLTLPQFKVIKISLMVWKGTEYLKDEAREKPRVWGEDWLTCSSGECCSVVSVGFRLVQLREVIRIPRGFDLGGCSMFQCVPERKVDVGVVLMLLCKLGLRPGFSKIDDNTIVPVLSPGSCFLSGSFLLYTLPFDHSRQHRNILHIHG